MTPSPTPRLLQGIRCLRLTALLLWISVALAVVFPLVGDRKRLRLKQRWSRQILQTLAIRVDECGENTGEKPGEILGELRVNDPASLAGESFAVGSLIVANHISWLDILAINAVQAVAFVSKAEVRQWPLVGWIAEKADTVFLRRGSRGHAKIVNAEIDALLNAGKSVAIFPEGTTTDGTHLLGFHAALLQPAVETGHPIQPVAISYHYADGRRSLAPAYIGETTLLESFVAILACRSTIVRVCATPAITPENRSRRELANVAHAAIASRLDNGA